MLIFNDVKEVYSTIGLVLTFLKTLILENASYMVLEFADKI